MCPLSCICCVSSYSIRHFWLPSSKGVAWTSRCSIKYRGIRSVGQISSNLICKDFLAIHTICIGYSILILCPLSCICCVSSYSIRHFWLPSSKGVAWTSRCSIKYRGIRSVGQISSNLICKDFLTIYTIRVSHSIGRRCCRKRKDRVTLVQVSIQSILNRQSNTTLSSVVCLVRPALCVSRKRCDRNLRFDVLRRIFPGSILTLVARFQRRRVVDSSEIRGLRLVNTFLVNVDVTIGYSLCTVTFVLHRIRRIQVDRQSRAAVNVVNGPSAAILPDFIPATLSVDKGSLDALQHISTGNTKLHIGRVDIIVGVRDFNAPSACVKGQLSLCFCGFSCGKTRKEAFPFSRSHILSIQVDFDKNIVFFHRIFAPNVRDVKFDGLLLAVYFICKRCCSIGFEPRTAARKRRGIYCNGIGNGIGRGPIRVLCSLTLCRVPSETIVGWCHACEPRHITKHNILSHGVCDRTSGGAGNVTGNLL